MVKVLTSTFFVTYYCVDIIVFIYAFFTSGQSDNKYYKPGIASVGPLWIFQTYFTYELGVFGNLVGLQKTIVIVIFALISIPFTWGIARIVLKGTVPDVISEVSGESYSKGYKDAKDLFEKETKYLEKEVENLRHKS